MPTHANPEQLNPVDTFKALLDEQFDRGEPRRHMPGDHRGEEELFLAPPEDVELFEKLPERIRAIRPKADNIIPVREFHPMELRGHRLGIVWPKLGKWSVLTDFYIQEMHCGAMTPHLQSHSTCATASTPAKAKDIL